MLYDQSQAFFSGIITVIARVGGAYAAFLLAMACYSAGFLRTAGIGALLSDLLLAPLIALGVILLWANKFGIGVMLGLAAIIMTVYFSWHCLHTDNLRKTLGFVFASAFVYFFPLAKANGFSVPIWLSVSAIIVALYFYSPKLMEIFVAKLEEKINERRNRIRLKLLLKRVKRMWSEL